jgi:hypothetical protein
LHVLGFGGVAGIGLTWLRDVDENSVAGFFQPSDRSWGGGLHPCMSDVDHLSAEERRFAAKLATLGTDDVAPPARL